MSRPPIIISNGGVAGELAKDCKNLNSDQAVEDKILDNVKRITDADHSGNHLSKVVVIKKGNSQTPCLYWRLTGPDTEPPHPGKAGVKINAIVDEQE